MFHIQTFTAQPDFIEDRIRLDAVDPEGQTQSIHVTRRLADRFLPLLINLVEEEVRRGLPRDIELAMAQQHIRNEREENPIPAVEPQEGSNKWLCVTVNLARHESDIQWMLTDEAENKAIMTLSDEGARVVLDVFLLSYRRMEWAIDVFPAWLTDEKPLQPQSPRTLN